MQLVLLPPFPPSNMYLLASRWAVYNSVWCRWAPLVCIVHHEGNGTIPYHSPLHFSTCVCKYSLYKYTFWPWKVKSGPSFSTWTDSWECTDSFYNMYRTNFIHLDAKYENRTLVAKEIRLPTVPNPCPVWPLHWSCSWCKFKSVRV